jgi:XTP/dITP diphosphohydrolase
VWQKVEEEISELHSAIEKNEKDKVEDEFGDLIFSLINYARFLQIDAENALERTNKKFISRFTTMEAEALKHSKKLDEMTLGEMDAIWNAIKHQQNT